MTFENVHDMQSHYAAVRKRLKGGIVPLPVQEKIEIPPPAVPAVRVLNTVAEVLDLFGGVHGLAKAISVSARTVRHWRSTGRIPPEKFEVITKEMSDRGASASPHVWRTPARIPHLSDNVVEFSPAIYRPTVAGVDYPAVNDVLLVVCQFYGVAYLDMISSRRDWTVMRPRQVAMYLAKELTLSAYPGIGKAMGGRDHTTAMHGCRKIAGLLLTDEPLADEVQILRMKVGDSMRFRAEVAS